MHKIRQRFLITFYRLLQFVIEYIPEHYEQLQTSLLTCYYKEFVEKMYVSVVNTEFQCNDTLRFGHLVMRNQYNGNRLFATQP